MTFSSGARRRATRLLPALAGLAVLAGLASGCAHARAERPGPPRAAQAPGGASAGALDPSEEITPEELASIPEPPGTSRRPAPADNPPAKVVPEPSEPRSAAGTDPTRSPAPAVPPGPWIWRVQILATPDRALADRVAREAADRLGTVARVDTNPPLHKVRLGAFTSEADAQVLKQRAVEMGYPGAFRIKIPTATTDD